MKLIFEKGTPGRHCHLLPDCDVPVHQIGVGRKEKLNLPELSENEISRHYTGLAGRAHGVNNGFYPLGSCTMKYNPKVNEEAASLEGFAGIHPLQPEHTVRGALRVFDLAEQYLCEITGMDAMTHAIEAYVSTANCDFTDPLALHAIKMIQKDLVDSYNGDMAKRDSMHNAQCLAGMAFSNALLGIVHSMAHKTGAAFADYGAHIIHGAANAMYLPKVIAFNAKDPEAKKRYGAIADEMKLGGSNDDEKVKLLIEYLRGMNDALNIPHCIKNYGPDSYPTEQGFVPEEVFLERLPEIAKNAIGDACTGSNPRQPSQEEMEKLLKCCYYDTEVDF